MKIAVITLVICADYQLCKTGVRLLSLKLNHDVFGIIHYGSQILLFIYSTNVFASKQQTIVFLSR